MNTTINNTDEATEYKKAFFLVFELYESMAADYASFFIDIEGKDYFAKDTARRMRIAKDAVRFYQAENEYEKLQPIADAISEFEERQEKK